jgi:hypothetical protein
MPERLKTDRQGPGERGVMVVLEPGIAKIGCAAEPKWVRNEPSPNKLLAGARALSEDLQAVSGACRDDRLG